MAEPLYAADKTDPTGGSRRTPASDMGENHASAATRQGKVSDMGDGGSGGTASDPSGANSNDRAAEDNSPSPTSSDVDSVSV